MIPDNRSPRIVDGIACYCLDVAEDHHDYPVSGLDILYHAENSHFWFVARRELITDTFTRFLNVLAMIHATRLLKFIPVILSPVMGFTVKRSTPPFSRKEKIIEMHLA